jgi:hypothetical protein
MRTDSKCILLAIDRQCQNLFDLTLERFNAFAEAKLYLRTLEILFRRRLLEVDIVSQIVRKEAQVEFETFCNFSQFHKARFQLPETNNCPYFIYPLKQKNNCYLNLAIPHHPTYIPRLN